MIRGVAAAANQPAAVEAATVVLEAGGSAADAVIAGFFAAAGALPGVLLAPAVALVAGAGVGARAFDGRAGQPGVGAARPRGYVNEADIPDAARLASPRSLSMLVLLHTYHGRAAWSTLARHGVIAAERAGAKARAGLLRRAGQSGVLALRGPEVARALLAVGGPVVGGLLTVEDLEEARPAEAEALTTSLGEATAVFTPPWAPPADLGVIASEVILACDGRGIIAAVSYVPARGGIAIPELEIEARCDAIPVRRGVTRVPPGTLLPAPAPVAIFLRTGVLAAAIALPGRPSVEPTSLALLASGVKVETALSEICDQGGGTAIAAVSDGRLGRAILIGG